MVASLVAIATPMMFSRQACAAPPKRETVVLFSHDDARKLRLTDEQWRHPPHARALSDGPNAWPLDRMAPLLATLVDLDLAVKKKPFEESSL